MPLAAPQEMTHIKPQTSAPPTACLVLERGWVGLEMRGHEAENTRPSGVTSLQATG